MALDKLQKQSLKRLVQEDAWDILTRALADYINQLLEVEISGNSEFETLRSLHIRQGKIDGLKEFFEKVERMNFED